MRVRELRLGCALAVGAALWACGGSDKPVLQVSSAENELEVAVDRNGAVLELEDRARVTIPPGALEERTMVRVRRLDRNELSARPGSDVTELEEPLVIEPHGLELRRPATVEMAVRAEEPADRDLRLVRLQDENDRSFEELETRVEQAETQGRALEEYDLRRSGGGEDSVSRRRRVATEVETFSVFIPVALGASEQPDGGVDPSQNGPCQSEIFGTVCRAARGPCDIAEVCDGENPECPPDVIAAQGAVCREATGLCDIAEECDGESVECPADEFEPAETSCDDGLFCTGTETCDGAGNCVSTGDPCAASSGDGDGDCAESCNEESMDCTGPDPDDAACADRACEQGTCQSGECSLTVHCPVFVTSAGTDSATCGDDWDTACASVQAASGRAEALLEAQGQARVFVRADRFTPVEVEPVLTMAEGVEYYGGFAGTENLLSERPEPLTELTVLDGAGNSFHVVVGASNARLDGFELTGGFGGPDDPDALESVRTVGGGMFNRGAEGAPLTGLVVANTVVRENALNATQDAFGAGIYNEFVDGLLLEDVVIEDNVAAGTGVSFGGTGAGGGMASLSSSVVMNGVSFLDNQATGVTALGGGLYAEGSAAHPVTLTDAQFVSNIAQGSSSGNGGEGGGVYARAPLSATRTDFLANQALGFDGVGSPEGGGLYYDGNGVSLSLTSVSFVDNDAGDGSPAVAGGASINTSEGGSFALANVTFYENEANGLEVSDAASLWIKGGSQGEAANIAVGGSNSPTEIVDEGTTSWSNVCAPADPGASTPGFRDVGTYTAQFAQSISDHVFLTSDSVCLDAASNTAADDAFGATEWPMLSSQIDGAANTGNVDHGRLYTPSGLWITRFLASDSTTLTWDVVAPAGASCYIYDLADLVERTPGDFRYDVPEADIASGQLTVSGPEVYFVLRCSVGGIVVRAPSAVGGVPAGVPQ